MKVLVVEDDPAQAALVTALLAKQPRGGGGGGAAVSSAHAGTLAAARREVAAGAIDVILLDLNLPDSQGLDTLRRMRRDASHTPIVVLSGEDDTDVALRALHEGAQDYLLKGQWPSDLLLRSIRYAMERHRMEMCLREREAERDALLAALSERVKELRALYETSKLLQTEGLSDAELFRGIIDAVRTGCQCPDATEVRVSAGDVAVASPGFAETPWTQTARFALTDGTPGTIDVACREDGRAADEGPFLAEERRALDAIAEMLRSCLDARLAQRRLRAQEEEFRTSFELAPVAKAHAEWGTWRLTRVNPRLCQVTGYTADELLSMTVMDLTHPDDRERTRQAKATVESGTVPAFEYEKRYVRKDGAAIWVRVTISPLYSPEGRPLKYIAVIEDVTERKRSADALARSERLLNSVIDTMPVGIWICDETGRIVRSNPAGDRIWAGRREGGIEQFGEHKAWWLNSGKPVGPREWALARAIDHGETSLDELIEIECFDGTRKVVRNCGMPIRDADGNVVAAIATNEDVTARLRAETALAESERFARAVVDALNSNIAILDERGNIISVNRAWRSFASGNGWDEDHCGPGTSYLASCDDAARRGVAEAVAAAAGIRRVLAGEADTFQLEYECSSPGQERWCEMTVTRFSGDGPRRLVVKHQDVTGRKHTEALERERTSLRDAVRAMDQVLSIVGHELRTPLAGLRILSEFLLTDGATTAEQTTTFLRNIHAEAIRMAETVNNLLEAARLDSGRAKWNWGDYCPEAVVRQAVEGVRALADAAGDALELESHLDGATVRGDGDAVRRLVLNFLSNAIRHTNGGAIRVTLRRDAAPRAGLDEAGRETWLSIEVSDTGCGIPPHILERLGQAFALNAGVVGARHIGGTGLGLSICRGIVEAHGGTVAVRSAVGQGTTVTARLRADLDAPRPMRNVETRGVVKREVAA